MIFVVHHRNRDFSIGHAYFRGDVYGYVAFEDAVVEVCENLAAQSCQGNLFSVRCEEGSDLFLDWSSKLPPIPPFRNRDRVDRLSIGDFARFCLRGQGGVQLTARGFKMRYVDDGEFTITVTCGAIDISNINNSGLLFVMVKNKSFQPT